MKTHRDVKPLPTEPSERKARIQWLMNHKVWTYPLWVTLPPVAMPPEPSLEKGNVLSFPGWEKEQCEDRLVDAGSFYDCVHFEFVYVNPENETIEDDEGLNTAFRVWIESGPWFDLAEDEEMQEPPEGWTDRNRWGSSHDIRLDCGAETVEEALLELAALVECFYDEDGESRDLWWCSWSEDDLDCSEDPDGFCSRCGFAYENAPMEAEA